MSIKIKKKIKFPFDLKLLGQTVILTVKRVKCMPAQEGEKS